MTQPATQKEISRSMIIAVFIIVVLAAALVGELIINRPPSKSTNSQSGSVNFFPTPTPTTSALIPIPTSTPIPSSTPIVSMPKLSSPYVEVDFETVGWFYANDYNNNNAAYNYTYLVIFVSITNDGYAQVPLDLAEFSVVINGVTYSNLDTVSNPFYNATAVSPKFDMFASIMGEEYNFPNSDWYGTELGNTGSVNGTIVFQFGDPNLIPQPPQILNQSYSLSCTMMYGNEFPYSQATVRISQMIG